MQGSSVSGEDDVKARMKKRFHKHQKIPHDIDFGGQVLGILAE